jgi:hypothetical protein
MKEEEGGFMREVIRCRRDKKIKVKGRRIARR